MNYDLSIIIPARNEMFLARTIEDILQNRRGNTEIIVVLDEVWADPPILDHPDVVVAHFGKVIGQRAACNFGVKLSSARWIMKVDAHCAFDEGFDVKLMSVMQDDWTLVPTMKNLHIFDWVCPKGHRRYQSPSGSCSYAGEDKVVCGLPTEREVVWIAKPSPNSHSFLFDTEPHFQYFKSFEKRAEGRKEVSETMSLQGSCFMISRERYIDLNICDEEFGSWGSQGIEVACKSWLSGGKVMCHHQTWYAHCFRTQGKDFGFPYPQDQHQVDAAKAKIRELFFYNKWPKQIHPLSWLLERFKPVPGWHDAAGIKTLELIIEEGRKFEGKPVLVIKPRPKFQVIYYTDNRLDERIMLACQRQIKKVTDDIISVSLKPLDFGHNIVLPLERSILTMFKQILAGLEASEAEYIFFCEHDVLYHPTHFDFIPFKCDIVYYNQNNWKVDAITGKSLFYYCKQTLGICAHRELLLEHYRRRVERVERDGYNSHIGFEPGSHHRAERIDDIQSDVWMSEYANIDIRHGKNLTPSRWSQDQFRNRRSCQGWIEAESVPGWGRTLGRFDEVLDGNPTAG